MVGKVKISKATVDRLPHNASGQTLYWDTTLAGFGMRVGQNIKAFIVQKKIAGKAVRVTIGTYGQITPEQARKEAQKILGEMTGGKNPLDEKKQAKARSIPLKEVFEDYLQARKSLKPKTVYNYKNLMGVCFKDWLKKPVVSISKDMIQKRHTKIGEKHGQAYSNFAMRVLRALFNFAAGQYEDSKGRSLILENPVKRLSQIRAWYKIKRRDDYIKPTELPKFFDVLGKHVSGTMRDFFLLLLFSGLRRVEAASLSWEQVDFNEKTLTILDTKNDEKLVLPLSDHLESLLKRRSENTGGSDYVFPGEGKSGHIEEPKRAMKRVRKALDAPLTIHGLRRSFITYADGLDLSAYAIKRLVNHKMSGDVTAGYIVKDVERLRKPMQQITDYILQKAGRKDAAKVIPLYKGGDY